MHARIFLLLPLLLLLPLPLAAADDAIRIGVLTDMSGSMADPSGTGSVEAAELAVEDAKTRPGARNAVIVSADYQNRGSVAEHISEGWLKDQGVDAIVDVPNAAIAARLQPLFQENNRMLLASTPGPSYASDSACSDYGFFWLYDRDTLMRNLIASLAAEQKTRWFLLYSEEPYSLGMARSARAAMQEKDIDLVGEAQLGTRMGGLDMVVEQMESLKPDIVFLAFDRPDSLHLMENWPEAHEGGPALAVSSLYIGDADTFSEKPLPHFYEISSFYWDQDDTTRAWSYAFARRNRGAMPSTIQASVYSSLRHYLQSIPPTGKISAQEVHARMINLPISDPLFKASHIRADGLVQHRLHLLLSKTRNERQYPWDYFRVVRTLEPAEQSLPAEVPCGKK
jgi:branched-chain amino acid transport system substrate-binding protein